MLGSASAPPIDPDREQARTWLADELARPGYLTQESWVERAWRWLLDRLPSLELTGQLPGWVTWVALATVLVAAVAVIAFGTRGRWRQASMAVLPGPRGPVLEEDLTAAAYRERAAAALARGDHDAALVDAYRALTASAVERTLLDDRPGRTAREVAADLSPGFPEVASELETAAGRFDEVRYGDHHATAASAREMAALDARLSAARPLHGAPR